MSTCSRAKVYNGGRGFGPPPPPDAPRVPAPSRPRCRVRRRMVLPSTAGGRHCRTAAARPRRDAADRDSLRPVVRRCRAIPAALPSTRGAQPRRCVILPIEAMVVGAFARRGRSPLARRRVALWMAIAATLVAVPSLYGVGYLRPSILPDRDAGRVERAGRGRRRRSDRHRRNGAAPGLAGRADRPTPAQLRLPRVRAGRHAAGAAAGRGRRADHLREAGKRRPRPPARSRERADRTHRGYVADHEHAVQALASTLADPALGPAERQRVVDRYHEIYPGSSPSSSPIAAASSARSIRRAPHCRRSPTANTSRPRCGTGRLAVSQVIVGRLSHVPIVTIAVPILRRRRVGGRRRRIARPVEVPALRRRRRDARRRARVDPRSARQA